MLFTSLEYIIFLPIIVILYYLISVKYKWILLLVASYYFYAAWDPRYIFLIIFSTLVAYFSSYMMSRKDSLRYRKPFLIMSFVTDIGILVFYKYYNFLLDNVINFFGFFDVTIEPMHHFYDLPIGLSFYTFQSLSYVVDVYRGNMKVEKHLGKFALYISYFPQLVAGPIERASALLPQFTKRTSPKYTYFREGVVLILWGYFKKVVIADRIGYYVTIVFGSPTEHHGMVSLLAILFFSIQIYCDFSGYTDIAKGSSLLFGIKLMENFRQPFFSINTKDLISRWHISLSQWFRDYLYFPLGGSQAKAPRIFLNLFIVWSLTGLWHGANWTYVVTAQLNCLFLILGIVTLSVRRKMLTSIGINYESKPMVAFDILITFLMGSFAMTFFRSKSIQDGLTIITNVFHINIDNILNANVFPDVKDFHVALASIVLLFILEYILEKYGYMNFMYKMLPRFVRYILIVLLLVSIMLLWFYNHNEFIYFQF